MMTTSNTRIALTGFVIALGLTAQAGFSEQSPEMGKRHAGKGPKFEQIDSNSDGQISREELQAHGAARFARMDADKDGSLTRDELIAAGHKKAERRADRIIQKLDANGNGAIETSEFEAGSERKAKMFKRLDKNGDGSISRDEFSKMKKRHRKG